MMCNIEFQKSRKKFIAQALRLEPFERLLDAKEKAVAANCSD